MESPPPLSCYISQSSKKRVFPGSSSTCMEADVVEIPPPVNRRSKSKPLKQKEVIAPEIIDVDMDEDSADVILVDKEVDSNGKGKETFNKYPLGSSSGTNHGSGNGLLHSLEKNNASGSHYFINGDGFGADFYGENDYMNMFHDDYLYDDYYTVQAHFDSLGIPPGVEVSVPWFMDHQENKMKSAVASTSTHSTSPIDLDAVVLPPCSDSSPAKSPLEFEQSNNKSTSGSSSLGAELKTVSYPKWETSSSLLEHQPLVWKRSTVARSPTNLPLKPPMDSWKSKMELFFKSHPRTAQSWQSKVKRYHGFSGHGSIPTKPLEGSSTDLQSHIETMIHQRLQPQPPSPPPPPPPPIVKTQNIIQPVAVSLKPMWPDMPKSTTIDSHPGSYTSGFVDSFGPLPFFPDDMGFGPWDKDPLKGQNSSGSFSGKGSYRDPNEFLKNFDLFKRFDTVQDSKDHHYCGHGSSLKQPSKNWAKKIQEEWRILENDLPDTIFVRVYESRMDLLRAVIIGAEGTPYHDGLFFFDLFFPVNYPNVPPLVHYHSGGLRINPNLYHCGKVCLSLLNTWSGGYKEKWIPGVSTTLQVLVSIQGLILNAKPFFNEPGYANMSGTQSGEKRSLQYNENTFILSLKTMVYSIRRPPKYFEDFVAGHFFKRAHDILVACKAYIDGAQVGCLVKGGVQDVDEGDKSCSQHFKSTLAGFIKTLVDTFAEVGVKDCDEFLSLAQQMTNVPVSGAPMTASYYY